MPHINLTFTDDDATPLPTHDANWTPYTGVAASDVTINSNAARRTAGSDGRYYYSVGLGVTAFAVNWNHYLQLAQGLGGITFNNSATSAPSAFYIRSAPSVSEWQLWRIINDSWAKIGSASFTFADDTTYSCRVERDSSTDSIKFLVDGVELISVTDSALKTNDRVGLGLEDTTRVFIDDLSTEDLNQPPTISNVDGDNAVNQGQLVNIDVSNFTETITSGDIGGVAFPSIPDNDPSDDVIQVRIPVTLSAGTYDVTISGATESATISGVSYTQTHARPAFDGLVDSNSILSGQSYTADTYFKFVTSFSNGTLDTAAGDAAEWAGDIADYYTPDAGFTGDDTASVQYLYSDGTTSATVVITVSVVDGIVVTVRLKKAMRNTMRKSMKQTMRAR